MLMSPEEVWTTFSIELTAYIRRHVSDRQEAEDILQEVATRLYKHESEIKDIKKIKAWLYRTAYNLVVDYYRARNRYALIADTSEIPNPAAPPQDNFNQETASCLLQLVRYLPRTYKEAIMEADYRGKKQSALGEKWGLSNSGSKSRIQRARKELKTVLLSCCEVQTDESGNVVDLRHKVNAGTEFSCLKC